MRWLRERTKALVSRWCGSLRDQGVTVVLTARNEGRGKEATKSLHESVVSNVIFHQLDACDPQSIENLAEFVLWQFDRLDILINNAGASGVRVDEDGLRAMNIDPAASVFNLIGFEGVVICGILS